MDTTETAHQPKRENRVPVTTLIRREALEWIDEAAHEHRLTRSQVIRMMLGLARTDTRLTKTLADAARGD